MSVRISAGLLHRRVVPIPDVVGLRPTSSKVRQALFNILGDIAQKTFLDLFSGSGLMSLEALSRGAVVTSIEASSLACTSQKTLKKTWDLTQWHILQGQVEHQLRVLKGQSFDMIFVDPPYDAAWCQQLPLLLQQYDIQTPLLMIEELAKVQSIWPSPWQVRETRRYGQTSLHFLEPS